MFLRLRIAPRGLRCRFDQKLQKRASTASCLAQTSFAAL